MARPTPLLDHGTALGDATRYDSASVKSGQKRNKNLIDSGHCGFRGCNDDRVGGVWADGGSYMCAIHMMLLMPLRIIKGEGLNQHREKKDLADMTSED